MKFIGQYIQGLIARFRDDVYLEGISTGTIASGGNLGLDSNNKIVKATEAAGDITGVTITTDSGGGSAASDTGGSADFSILGANGVGVTNSGTTITAVAVPGEIDHDSLNNFVANEHLRWDNDVSSTATIHASNVPTLNQNTTGSAATLTTERDLQVNLASTSADGFDGGGNADNIGVSGTLAVGNGGTGLTGISTLLNSNVTTISGNAGTATNLVASTSTAVQLGTIELGHADDTTIARSASGIITVEGKEVRTIDRHIHIQFSSFRDDIGTSPHFVPWHTEDENTTNTNENIPFIAPYAGKLLELHYRTSKNTSGATATWELVQIEKTEQVLTSNNDTLDTQTCTGPTNAASGAGNLVKVTFDSDAAFAAGDMLALKITHDTDVTDANTKFYITTIWEYDLSTM